MSGAACTVSVERCGVDAHLFDTGERSLADLAAAGFERVFIALHGRYGEDGTLQERWTAGHSLHRQRAAGPSLSMDKIMTKRVWLQHGLAHAGLRGAGRQH